MLSNLLSSTGGFGARVAATFLAITVITSEPAWAVDCEGISGNVVINQNGNIPTVKIKFNGFRRFLLNLQGYLVN